MASPNALHFMGFAGQKTNVFEVPLCFIKYDTFAGNAEIETEEDKGHTGSRSLLLGEDRVKATGSPEIEDKIRPEEGAEDLFYHVLGSYAVETFGTKVKKYTFTPNPDGTLPKVSILHGFNVAGRKARGFANAIGNELTLTMNADSAPKINVKYLSDFPKYNITPPTLSFLANPPQSFKSGQLSVFMGETGGIVEATDGVGCLKESSLTISNNAENTVCAGTTLGASEKDVGEVTIEGSLKVAENDKNATLEQLWATGSTTGETVTFDSLFKSLRFRYTGKEIETVAETKYPYMLEINLPKIDIKSVKPTEGGDGSKELDIEFKAVTPASDDIISVILQSQLAGLHITA